MWSTRAWPFIAGLAAILTVTPGGRAAETGYSAQPSLHGDRLVFVSEGDLWTATLAAGAGPIVAHRLTSSDGSESHPVIGPDGGRLAFSAEYDGNTDVYVMPIDGGPPRRVTSHPDPDVALAWSPDGREVLFRSGRAHPHGRPELWRVSAAGGMPRRHDFGECSLVAMSSTGSRIAFTPWSNENWHWKRYRGGTAPEIWVGDLSAGRFTQLTDDRASDLFPMWMQGRVYFVSDRTGTANIFSDRPDSGDLRQHTRFAPDPADPTAVEGYDVRWPAGDAQRRGARIVFCQAGGLALLDLADDAVRRLDVRIASDRVAARQRFGASRRTLSDFALTADGETILATSRGEILLVPVDEDAAPRQLTRTAGAREWGAVALGDEHAALITDAAGEQQVAVVPLDGSDAPSLVTEDREAWLLAPVASPDGRLIAFADMTMRLHVVDVRTLERRQVDRAAAGEITDYRFSPDSRWLAYVKPTPNGFGSIHLYSVRTERTFPVSDGRFDEREPRWDPKGRYLYFLSRRHFDPMVGQFDFDHVYVRATRIMALPLAADIPPPLPALARAAGFDLEDWAKPPEVDDAADDDDADDEAEADAEADAGTPPIRVETDGLAARATIMPIEAGAYAGLEAVPGGVLYLRQPLEGLRGEDWPSAGLGEGKATLHRRLFAEKEPTEVAAKVARYRLDGRGTVVAVARGHGFDVIELGGDETKTVALEDLRLHIDVRREWEHILAEAWRLQRDFYWAPNLVGVDWPAMREKYAALLPRVGTRTELNDVVGEMIGELGTSHAYIWGGERQDQAKPVSTGLLGIDVTPVAGGFRIDRVLPDDGVEPDGRSPLAAAHLAVTAGDVIVGVNDAAMPAGANLHDLLRDQAGRRVRLAVAAADGAGRRTVEVEAIGSERRLRYRAWVESNRRFVEEASEGRLGYVHIPDMGGEGLAAFSRMFYPQIDKPGLVIDVRNNGGGFVSQMIIERLARRPLGYDQPRHGTTTRYPQRSLVAHLAVVMDQHAGSDGDIFPASFRAAGLGPLIGTRTWGGVVGIRADKPFVDLGMSTQPEYAWWDTRGGWSIENEGVEPDIEVPLTPADRTAGRDPQLDRAVQWLLRRLEEKPMETPAPPPYPVR
ncbi:MAG: S41 family peptidase, partial [Planctomycetota bacterium]